MIRSIHGVLISLALAGCRPAAMEGPPHAEFAFARRDLGDIPLAPEGRVIEFPVVNRGLSELQLLKVVRSCTCVDTQVSRSVLQSGESGVVALAIAPARAEEKSASVSVHTNDPRHPIVRLEVAWRSHAPIEIEPLEIDFGRLRPGQTAERTAKIVRHESTGSPDRVMNLTTSPTDRLRVTQAGERLTILLTAGSSPGPGHGDLAVELNGADRHLSVPLRWHVADIIEVQPREVMAGSGNPGERATGRVVVSAEPGRRLEIASVRWEGVSESVGVNWKRLAEDRVLADVSWILPTKSGAHRGDLVIACEQPERRTLRVPVSTYVFADSIATKEGGP